MIRNTRGSTGGWTMGPSAAWFYEDQPSSAPKQQQEASASVADEINV